MAEGFEQKFAKVAKEDDEAAPKTGLSSVQTLPDLCDVSTSDVLMQRSCSLQSIAYSLCLFRAATEVSTCEP